MSAFQTLEAGNTIGDKYGRLGFTNVTMIPPPLGLRGLILGACNSGKSYLLQSCPEMFIFNLDLSSTVVRDLPATIWPGLTPEGRPFDPEEGEIILTYDRVKRKLETLHQMAMDQYEGRPRCIAFDSTSSLIRLLRKHAIENAPLLGLKKEPVAQWNDLDGQAAWEWVYSTIEDLVIDLPNDGYGVYFVMHLVDKILRIDRDHQEKYTAVNITDNFKSRIWNLFELVGAVIETTEYELGEKREIKTADGRHLKWDQSMMECRKRYFVSDPGVVAGNLDADNDLVKHRITIPGKIELPSTDPWAAFTTAYEAAATLIPPSPQKDES